MVNLAPIHTQMLDEKNTKEMLNNKYKPVKWLGRTYSSLYKLCESKGIPYSTIKDRIKSGIPLTEAILNCKEHNEINNVVRLHKTGVFDTEEICLALNLPPERVNYLIRKFA